MDLSGLKKRLPKPPRPSGRNKGQITFLATVIVMVIALGLLGWGLTRVYMLEHALALLESQYQSLETGYQELEGKYTKVWMEQAAETADEERSTPLPYTAISEGNIQWVWQNRDGDTHRWAMPMDSYLMWANTPKPNKKITLQSGDEIYAVRDYRPYVHGDEFTQVVPQLYARTSGGREFVQEVFHMVSQLTVYADDIGNNPRWPIETLTEGRGDCEDLTILLASLLKAAPYDYTLKFVYTDASNPTQPQYPDHVLLAIEDGEEWRVFTECTSDSGWRFYDHVKGWFFEF